MFGGLASQHEALEEVERWLGERKSKQEEEWDEETWGTTPQAQAGMQNLIGMAGNL